MLRPLAFAASFVLVAGVFPACSSSDDAPAPTGGTAPGCDNGVRDGDETGIDCGGRCKGCAGSKCTTPDDCNGGPCNAGECGPRPGKACGVATGTLCANGAACEQDADCQTDVCDNAVCVDATTANHTDGRRNAGETGIDCGGSVKDAAPCPEGQACKDSSDCAGACNAGTCGAPGPTDGKKDNGETDIDCGGPNAPGCATGKACAADADCADKYCPAGAPQVCVKPTASDGVKNGTETDTDCGGGAPTNAPKCAPGKACQVDGDCTAACNYKKKCVEAPSCRPRMGGDTCGPGEVFDGGAGHESCCRTLPVPGFTDAAHAGKTVYLDKYEITAGRMRAFIDDVMGKNGGVPNVKGWFSNNTPAFWNAAWSKYFPVDTQNDSIALDHPSLGSGVPSPAPAGMDYNFGSVLYVYVHGHNCYQGASSYGFPTFYYPPNVMTENGGLARAQSYNDGAYTQALNIQDALDVKTMTCVTNAMLVAFCQWDGGQLATDEVLDFVANKGVDSGNTGTACSRCTSTIGAAYSGKGINATSDSGTGATPYFYPQYKNTVTHEGVSRIASPGRMVDDVVRINAGDEPWMDLGGNVNEQVLDTTNGSFTNKFGLKFRGIGYSSARALQNPTALTYPEYKAAYSGGRCMRFK
jgi:hypothetical protein